MTATNTDDEKALFAAASEGDVAMLKTLLKSGDRCNPNAENGDGHTALLLAAKSGHLKACSYLVQAGGSWNHTNERGDTAGSLAKQGGHDDLYKELVNIGVRTELILSHLSQSSQDDDGGETSNAAYLQRPLVFSEGRILDADGNAVMMGWEAEIMRQHADVLCPVPGKTVLNVGYGLGIVDRELQKRQPEKHYIIEAHPDVYKQMLKEGWDKKPGVVILHGRWQDVMDQLIGVLFDGIFFDTFGEHYTDMQEFHEHLLNIMKPGGIYSFFNGLCATNEFFHDVASVVAELELKDMGFEVEFRTIADVNPASQEWDGVLRAYWSLPHYRLPICTLGGTPF